MINLICAKELAVGRKVVTNGTTLTIKTISITFDRVYVSYEEDGHNTFMLNERVEVIDEVFQYLISYCDTIYEDGNYFPFLILDSFEKAEEVASALRNIQEEYTKYFNSDLYKNKRKNSKDSKKEMINDIRDINKLIPSEYIKFIGYFPDVSWLAFEYEFEIDKVLKY